ncbi:MAG: ABC-F family ATP-binding cassette domain-containing protein [Anaerolineae bacterium]|nr:ABC-F family ATP-binding cassette domain-containing protein [Anaerolineae bacterium]
MLILTVNDLTIHYGGHTVFEGLGWQIGKGKKIGLVGANGVGKSTLFKLLAGDLKADGGTIWRHPGTTIGYMAQEPRLDPERTVLDEALDAVPPLRALERRLQALEEQMAQPEVYGDMDRLAQVMAEHERRLTEYEHAGGLTYRNRVVSTLRGFGFTESDLDLPCGVLSGGQKKLVDLTRLLVFQPDVLLLDEPDNHLDVEGKTFLERLIVDYPGTVVIISHDRYLLDIVAEEIAELEDGRIIVWPGNYSEYAFAKRQALLQQQKMFELQGREIERLRQAMFRIISFSSGGQNEKMIKRARNVEKRIERLKDDQVDKPILERKTMGLQFQMSTRGSDKVLEMTDVAKTFDGDEFIFEDIDLLIWQGERVGLVGPNGAGKSVLFRLVLGRDEPTWGSIKLGPSVNLTYYAQEHQTLDYDSTPLEQVRSVKPMYEREAFGYLGRFLFGFQKAQQQVKTLSGGEKARLQMAKLMLSPANFLLLDEPTNNLDIPSCEVLEDALQDFKGTTLIISHDRYFLDRLCTRIVELRDGKLVEYAGNYTYYQAKKREEAQAQALVTKRTPSSLNRPEAKVAQL